MSYGLVRSSNFYLLSLVVTPEVFVKRQTVLFAITATALGGAIWVVPWHLVRYGLAFALLWVLPGLAWVSLVPRKVFDRAEWLAVGLGLGFVVTPAITLLASYFPGPLTRTKLLAMAVGSAGLPIVLSALARLQTKSAAALEGQQTGICFTASLGPQDRASIPAVPRTQSWRHLLWQDGWAWLLAAILIAAGLRIANLHYSEFQGDEAIILVRAARALEGDKAVVFQHMKAPAEIALTMAGWRLTGVVNEWMARLPFAWAGILGLAAVFLFGRRLGYPHAGGIAVCLLAINGYFVGFGRIVQYQSLVFALGTLGLLCLLVYHTQGHGSPVVVGAALMAGGLLAHYDVLLSLPAGLILLGTRLWHTIRRRRNRRRIWQALTPMMVAALVGAVLIGLFYLPFLRSPYPGFTLSYLSRRIGGGQHFYNHLRSLFDLSAVYNAVYFLAVMLLALAAQASVAWARWGRVGLGLSGGLLAIRAAPTTTG